MLLVTMMYRFGVVVVVVVIDGAVVGVVRKTPPLVPVGHEFHRGLPCAPEKAPGDDPGGASDHWLLFSPSEMLGGKNAPAVQENVVQGPGGTVQ